jgi:hypothetical protein
MKGLFNRRLFALVEVVKGLGIVVFYFRRFEDEDGECERCIVFGVGEASDEWVNKF